MKTYFGAIDVDAIDDPQRRSAVQSMIRNYGQAPRQLFPNHPHPSRTMSNPFATASPSSAAVTASRGISWLIRLLLLSSLASPARNSSFRQSRTSRPMANSCLEPQIALVKSHSIESEEDAGERPEQSCSVIPRMAGTPLDTVKGLEWGKWAGSPAVDQPVSSCEIYIFLNHLKNRFLHNITH